MICYTLMSHHCCANWSPCIVTFGNPKELVPALVGGNALWTLEGSMAIFKFVTLDSKSPSLLSPGATTA